jgi:hypothetical protein
MTANPSAWLNDAFASAMGEFKRSLKNPAMYDFSKITSIDDVYKATDEIQKQQLKTKTLRGLKRIKPLIDALNEYSGVVEVFVQVKPEVLGLIWVRPSKTTSV